MTGRIELIINGKTNAIRDATSQKEIDDHIERWRPLIETLTTDDTYSIVTTIESDFKSKRRLRNEKK